VGALDHEQRQRPGKYLSLICDEMKGLNVVLYWILLDYNVVTSFGYSVVPIQPRKPGDKPKRLLWSSQEEALSAEQQEALDMIKEGANVFITGVAGTGKSLVLRKALEYLKDTYGPDEYAAVGPTGPTAVALEGQTIHSFAGIAIPRLKEDFLKSRTNKKKAWKNLKVLVLDEVSMISGEFFDLLSDVVKKIRKDPRPFGGIQLVVSGDFLQLSPIEPRYADLEQLMWAVMEKEGLEKEEAKLKLFGNRGFCFQAYEWEAAKFKIVQLVKVFRQQNTNFIDILDNVRKGYMTAETLTFLETKCQRPLPPNEFGIQPTRLYALNKDVSRENLRELNMLDGETVSYQALDSVAKEKGAPIWAENQLLKSGFFSACIAEQELQLKVGAQVMVIKNEAIGYQKLSASSRRNLLVNGSRGKVIGFRSVREEKEDQFLPGVDQYPIVQFVDGFQKVIKPARFQSTMVGVGTCTRLAIPLKLAWAITTHKSQGCTLDFVIADVGDVFANGQVYVALSRASDENGLELRNFSPSRVKTNRLALSFYEAPYRRDYPYWDGGTTKDAPIVLLESSDRKTTSKERPVSARKGISENRERKGSVSPSALATKTAPPVTIRGRTFVFAGVFETMTTPDSVDLVTQNGGFIRQSVSGKTNYVVLGPKLKNGMPSTLGSIFKKAQSHPSIQILTEDEFRQWMGL
jgi:ATP-dependent DNA helicase PIF1